MRLFDKIKSFANQVAGTAAKVTLVVEATSVKEPIKVKINAVVKMQHYQLIKCIYM